VCCLRHGRRRLRSAEKISLAEGTPSVRSVASSSASSIPSAMTSQPMRLAKWHSLQPWPGGEVAVHVTHEADVELEVSGRELDDVLHARETGAGVVDREVDPNFITAWRSAA